MDYFLLLLTGKLLQCTATHWRLLGGAAIGAAMACVVIIVPNLPVVIKLTFAYIGISYCMVRITFSLKKWKMVVRGTSYLYFFTFLLGGVMQWFQKKISFMREMKLQWFGIAVLGYFAVLIVVWEMNKRKSRQENTYRDVYLKINDKEIKLLGLIDTGNGLIEPISGKPVSVISKRVIEQEKITFSEENLRVIPYHSIGKGKGYLIGHEIDEMIICTEERDVVVKNAILGISEEEISSRNSYEMILHHELIHHL